MIGEGGVDSIIHNHSSSPNIPLYFLGIGKRRGSSLFLSHDFYRGVASVEVVFARLLRVE